MSEDARGRRGLVLPVVLSRWGLVVALAFAALHGPYVASRFERNTWLYADGSFYFKTIQAVAEHGRLEQKDLHPRSWYEQDLGWNRELDPAWSNIAAGRDGSWYPKHPILLPVLSVPFYWLFGTPGTLAVNVLLNLLFVLLVFTACARLARPWLAAAIAILVAAQDVIVHNSYSFSNDVLGGVLLVGALDATLRGAFRRAGVLAGFAVWARVTQIAFVPALMLVAWGEAGLGAVWLATRWALVPLGLFAVHNWWEFGAPWLVSYQRVLSRVGGVTKVLPHSNNFTVPFAQGFRRVVLGEDGAFRAFLPFAPGLLGLPALPRRRWALGVGVLLFCVPYVLLLVKYDWYRAQFLYPVFGASALGLAAAGERFLWQRREDDARTFVVPPIAFAVFALVLAGSSWAAHSALRRDPALLSSRLEEAHVFLGEKPCDYFNPQNERWECSHFDRGEAWLMTGRTIGEPIKVGGVVHRSILMHPHRSREWRRLVFDDLLAREVTLDLALGDASRPGDVQVEILTRGAPTAALTLSRAGQEEHRTIAIAPGSGPALEVRVKSADPEWKHFVFEGHLVP